MKNAIVLWSLFASIFLPTQFALALSYYPNEIVEIIQNEKIQGKELQFYLHTVTAEQQRMDLTYSEARKIMFGDLFLEKIGPDRYQVKEVYCNITHDESAGVGPNKIPNPEMLNCEHTWPQSKFSKEFPSEIQKSDLHHLFPSDMQANSTRNNHPFAEVKGKPTADHCRDSKIGQAIDTTITAFEPPKEHRGNVARAMSYFSVRYKMPIDPVQKKYFTKWNDEDPVDAEERERHEKIVRIQGNRNPFIDHPDLIKRL